MNEIELSEELMRILKTITHEEQRSLMPACLQQWQKYYSQCPEYISEGGNWIVYKVIPKTPIIINDTQYDNFVLKIKKEPYRGDISHTVSKYKALLKSGFKTVSFLQPAKISDSAYECENINEPYRKKESNYLYVSPNTIKCCSSEIHVLDPIFSIIGTNLIYTIKDFEQNVTELIEQMQDSESKARAVIFSEDAIFIGVMANNDKSVSLDYKIADFDFICRKGAKDKNRNVLSMLTTLDEFIQHYVSDNSPNKQRYSDYIHKLFRDYTE